ncbi:hypothetical protein MPLSOD_40150 [Mesorhizobium sp. SOD10]|nr:hypothetical protein MPLSOD_40150 [Mesorhizobium sp. SOD10]
MIPRSSPLDVSQTCRTAPAQLLKHSESQAVAPRHTRRLRTPPEPALGGAYMPTCDHIPGTAAMSICRLLEQSILLNSKHAYYMYRSWFQMVSTDWAF